MCYVLCSATLACPKSIWKLTGHVFWGIAIGVQSHFLKPESNAKIIAFSIAKPPERFFKGRDRLFALAPKWPIKIGMRPPPMMRVRSSPCNAVVCTFLWRKIGSFAGLVISTSCKLVEFSF
jgi:hypothetical protein